jgi:alanine-synthesizing transaminase
VKEFARIQRLPPYVFESVNKLKAQARGRGEDIIDLGMGNPDLPAPKHVIDKLIETVQKPRVHGYSASRGIPGLRRAMAAYYDRRFGVKLDPETEVIATLGSKEGFANLAQAITSPGDVVLVPSPAYPIHAYGFILTGEVIRQVSAPDAETYLANLSRAIKVMVPAPSVLVINYPSNPTAEVCTLDLYKEFVAIAKRHDLLILSDLAYSELYFDGNPPPSILEVEGAKDITVEINSLSKTYSMAGWRIGYAVGNERMIAALARVKSYLDYGAFTPIQVAATAALNGPQDCVDEMRRTYQHRRDVLVESFARAGWQVPTPKATMFAWAPIPPALSEKGSLEFSKMLLTEAKVAVSPGIGFGEQGEGHVRIAMVENEQRIRQAARSIKKFLESRGVNTGAATSAKHAKVSAQ